jgi:ketosteroid isomerase-like protein
MIEHNKLLLMKANDAVSKGDYEAFLDCCTEDTKWLFVGDQVLNGKKEVRKWMSTTYIKPPEFSVDHLIAENDYVTALGKITLINEKGTGAQHWYCDVWKFRDGKLAELTAFVMEP